MFQSSPDPKAGRYQRTITFECRLLLFQSSPDPKAGRYRHPPHNAGWQHSSNPHPTRRPGATGHHGAVSAAVGSSNPHPTRRPGATFALGVLCVFVNGSNPHPTRRPGATWCFCHSLFTKVFQSSPDPKAGRYKFTRHNLNWFTVFQSSPDPKAGRYTEIFSDQYSSRMFQSSPDPKAGRYAASAASFSSMACSNPHPTRRPGATTDSGTAPSRALLVPILNPTRRPGPATSIKVLTSSPSLGSNPHPTRRPGATGQPRAAVEASKRPFIQSSPDPKAGRLLISYRQCQASNLCSSNPHPTPKAGRYLLLLPTDRNHYEAGSNPHPTRRPGATANHSKPLRGKHFSHRLREGWFLAGRTEALPFFLK